MRGASGSRGGRQRDGCAAAIAVRNKCSRNFRGDVMAGYLAGCADVQTNGLREIRCGTAFYDRVRSKSPLPVPTPCNGNRGPADLCSGEPPTAHEVPHGRPDPHLNLKLPRSGGLVEHLRERTDVQNIDLMNLAGFCRNCLSNWMKDAADQKGIPLSKDQAREAVYGMPYEEWRAKYQKEATAGAESGVREVPPPLMAP